jgi:hypothetical protein
MGGVRRGAAGRHAEAYEARFGAAGVDLDLPAGPWIGW